jgi:hypothetical protein
MNYLEPVRKILLSTWVGGMMAIGYIAAPTLFAMLDDRKLAGSLAGEMFHVINWLGLVCGTVLLLVTLTRYGRIWQFWVLLVMLLLVLNNEFVLQPMMAELKLQGLIAGSSAKARFGMLHGIASILYLLTSALGLALVATEAKKPNSGR